MRIIVNRRKKGVNFNLNQVTDLAYQVALQIFFAPGKMKVKEGTKSVEEGKIIFLIAVLTCGILNRMRNCRL